MSVFRVKLQNVGQGLLDIDPTTSVPFVTSKQRQVYVMGPKKINRLLVDGATFTDCNYWKRFTAPTVPYDQAFIEVVDDDGSVYSDIPEENTFGVGATFTLTTSFADSVIDFVDTYGGPARFLQITNTDGGSDTVVGELNGDANVTFTLAAGDTQVFNAGDLAITLLRLKSNVNATCFVIGSVMSTCNS